VKFGATRLLLKPAKVGKGIIAGPVVSALATVAGIKDIYAKLFASKTRVNAL
jgi:small subunit ribosomal protein S5